MKKLLKLFKWSFILMVVSVLSVVAINYSMLQKAEAISYNDTKKIPERDVALVLGCSFKTARGNVNMFFQSRMKAVAALYKAGKIKHILVSGDNGRKEYDESTDMKNYLVNLGIKEKDITLDFAGFRTLDSVVRAKEIFGVEKLTVVSQAYHTPRALFLCESNGIDAIAFNAKRVEPSTKAEWRETLARVKAYIDVYVLNKKPKFLGKKEVIKI